MGVPAGRPVRVTSSRLVSLTQRAVAAICYQVEPVDAAARVVVQSELVANEQLPVPGGDPRRPAALQAPLQGEEHFAADGRAMLMHRTGRSDLRMAAAMDHRVACAADLSQQAESWPDLARLTVAARLQPGQRLGIVKFAAFGWSGGHNASDGLHIAALAGSWMALVAGFGGLRTHHGKLSFAPLLREALARLAFAVRWRGRLVRAEVTAESASYALGSGEPASIRHYDETVTLASGQPRTLPIRPSRRCRGQPSPPGASQRSGRPG